MSSYVYVDGSSGTSAGLTAGGVSDADIIIDVTDTTAFTVRKNGNGGDVLVVDTSTPAVTIGNASDTTNLVLGKGVISNATDSAALPGFTWTGDLNTGMSRLAADQIGFSCGGSTVLGLTSTTATFDDKVAIDITDTAALNVRKNGSGVSIFNVDTSANIVTVNSASGTGIMNVYSQLNVKDSSGNSLLNCDPSSGTTLTLGLNSTGLGGNLRINGKAATDTVGIQFADSIVEGRVQYDLVNQKLVLSTQNAANMFMTSTLNQFDVDTVVDITDTAAFKVRKNSSGGDIFTVDTTTPRVYMGNTTDATILYLVAPTTARLRWSLDGTSSSGEINVTSTNMTFLIAGTSALTTTASLASFSTGVNIGKTSTSALTVKDGSANQVFGVDTSGSIVTSDGKVIIDITDTAALVVRKNSSGGDVFNVDTTTPAVTVGNGSDTTNLILAKGTHRVPDGVVGTPSYSFTNSTGTGLWYNGSNSMIASVAGTQVQSFATARNTSNVPVDIQNTSTTCLRVRAAGASPIVLTVDTSGSIITCDGKTIVDVTDTAALVVRKDAAAGNIFNVDTSGNIISIGNSTNGTDATFITSASGTSTVKFNNGSADNGSILFDHSVATGGQMTLKTNNTSRMTLSSNGANFINPIQLPPFTVGTLPSASTVGRLIYVSDDALGKTIAMADGSNWLRLEDLSVVTTSATSTTRIKSSSFEYYLNTFVTTHASGILGSTNFPVTSYFNNGSAFGTINATSGKITVNETGYYHIGYTVYCGGITGTAVEGFAWILNDTSSVPYGHNTSVATTSGYLELTGTALMFITAADNIDVNFLLAGTPLTTYTVSGPETKIWGYKVSS